jgi:hypothetical protein
MNPPADLLALLEYRMHAVAVGHMALRQSMTWEDPPGVQILFNGRLVVEGNATAFTNPAIEAAIIHARALLEFLGLILSRDSPPKLKERSQRDPTDYGIEQFGDLSKVSIARAASSYPGPSEEAEAALACVIYLANKGLAHTTSSFTKNDQDARFLEIALRGVPILVINNFYLPLGLQPPQYVPPQRSAARLPESS